MAREGCRIAVIGAGFSGVMTAIHLLWRCEPGERVYLVERSGRLGPGLAYSTSDRSHLVNVRAENMSAFADEPDHFVRWLERLGPEQRADAAERTIAGTFARRSVFGAYVQELLREAIARQDGADNLYLVADAAVAIRPSDGSFLLETANGRSHRVDAAVLALGNVIESRDELPGYVANPWSAAATAPLAPDRPVVMLGTGLTMVDVCLSLVEQGFAGPIHAISRRGLLPLGHAPSTRWDGLRLHGRDRGSLLNLFMAVRREVRRAGGQSDRLALRDRLGTLAGAGPLGRARAGRQGTLRAPRAALVGHPPAPHGATGRRYHRGPAGLRSAADPRREDHGIDPTEHALRVRWRPKGESIEQQLLAQRVIDCTGATGDHCRSGDPLVRQLLADGLARPAPLGLGVDCSTDGALLGVHGQPSPHLFAVGPVTRGALWEIIAVPEIRAQAEQVAERTLAAARSRFTDAA